MTEQWNELKETIEELRDNGGTGTQKSICKFLMNYMNLLEKQVQAPSDSYVNRQEVVNAIANTCFWLSADNWSELMECINSVPPVTITFKQEPEWISIDNKLPEEGYSVLVCSNSGEIRMTYGWYPKEEKDFWIWGGVDDEFGDVVAWMPLPKPYKKDIEYIF